MNEITLSVVVPTYYEKESLPIFVPELIGVVDSIEGESEVVLVDDGSSDGTLDLMLEFAGSNG